MEPAFQRGDLLFLTNKEDPIRVGEIVVFKVEGREIPIVHRVLKIHEKWVCSFTSSLNFINILNVKYLASVWILISKWVLTIFTVLIVSKAFTFYWNSLNDCSLVLSLLIEITWLDWVLIWKSQSPSTVNERYTLGPKLYKALFFLLIYHLCFFFSMFYNNYATLCHGISEGSLPEKFIFLVHTFLQGICVYWKKCICFTGYSVVIFLKVFYD